MRMICPSCGAVASADAWQNDPVCREAIAKVAALPGPVSAAELGYLGLFRHGQTRALSWKRMLRLATEIEVLVGRGFVHVKDKPDKSCPPSLWAQGMEQMAAQRAGLRLPMVSHGYLEKVVWDLAEKADYSQEAGRQASAKQHQRPVAVTQTGRAEADPLLDPMEKARREWDAKHGVPLVTSFAEVSKLIGRIDDAD